MERVQGGKCVDTRGGNKVERVQGGKCVDTRGETRWNVYKVGSVSIREVKQGGTCTRWERLRCER